MRVRTGHSKINSLLLYILLNKSSSPPMHLTCNIKFAVTISFTVPHYNILLVPILAFVSRSIGGLFSFCSAATTENLGTARGFKFVFSSGFSGETNGRKNQPIEKSVSVVLFQLYKNFARKYKKRKKD